MGRPWNTFIEGDNLDVLPRAGRAGRPDLHRPAVQHRQRLRLPRRLPRRRQAHPAPCVGRDDAATAGGRPGGDERARGDLRQHRRQRDRLPAAADGRGVRRAELRRADRGEPQPEGPPARQGFASVHEYLLVYARDARTCTLDATSTETVSEHDFPLTDGDGRRYRHLPLRNTNKKFNPVTARTLHFTVCGDPASGRVGTLPFDGAQEIGPVFGDGTPAVWRWSRPLIDERPGDLVCRVDAGRARRARRRLPEGLAARAGGARSCARSGWPTRSARRTPRSPSSRRSSATSSSPRSRPAWCAGFSAPCPTTPWCSTSSPAAARPGTRSRSQNVADGGTRRCVSVNSAEPTREGSNARNAGLRSPSPTSPGRGCARSRPGWVVACRTGGEG